MTLRHATIQDASFIALVVFEALGMNIMNKNAHEITPEEEHKLQLVTQVIRREDTLYSWKNTLVAQDSDGTLLGAIVAYMGDDYMGMKTRTFNLLAEIIDFDVESMDPEALPGEYYLDSLAVTPASRGKGVGKKLLCAARDQAFAMSRPAILACDPDNLGAKALYQAMGFAHEGDLHIFGHHYLRMVARAQ